MKYIFWNSPLDFELKMNKFNIFSNLSVLMNAGFHVERILKLLTLFLSLIVSNITNNVRIRIVRFFNLPLFFSFCNISISITTGYSYILKYNNFYISSCNNVLQIVSSTLYTLLSTLAYYKVADKETR